MEKDFQKWLKLQETIDNKIDKPPYFKEGDIWWCTIGINIGSEIYGKGDLFLRPVLIIKKLSKNSFFGLPLSSKIKKGSWYVHLKNLKNISCVNLAQLRTFDSKRLLYKNEQISDETMTGIRESLKNLMSL